ncbi:hypothetical protein COU74_03770 [Candidatus Peregrinibacteria bacterium CG10_big_fil_rev_8_21_14_0_10_36_19]|nr:MAG: hypothetical protein COU74_03770 [Candidatus Peregrinibacteria bacterium CG10_big_fil_rev_8_21_14_0_10_36_19]
MNLSNGTSLIFLILTVGILGMIIIPLITSLILRFFARLLKFAKSDFKTALYCNLVILGIHLGITMSLGMLFLDRIQELSSVLSLFSLVVSLMVGVYVVHKFYGSSLIKSFFALFLTGLTLFVGLFIIVLFLGLGIVFVK